MHSNEGPGGGVRAFGIPWFMANPRAARKKDDRPRTDGRRDSFLRRARACIVKRQLVHRGFPCAGRNEVDHCHRYRAATVAGARGEEITEGPPAAHSYSTFTHKRYDKRQKITVTAEICHDKKVLRKLFTSNRTSPQPYFPYNNTMGVAFGKQNKNAF